MMDYSYLLEVYYYYYYFLVLGIEPRVMCMLTILSTTQIHPQSQSWHFKMDPNVGFDSEKFCLPQSSLEDINIYRGMTWGTECGPNLRSTSCKMGAIKEFWHDSNKDTFVSQKNNAGKLKRIITSWNKLGKGETKVRDSNSINQSINVIFLLLPNLLQQVNVVLYSLPNS
jgi:hypothetical protein